MSLQAPAKVVQKERAGLFRRHVLHDNDGRPPSPVELLPAFEQLVRGPVLGEWLIFGAIVVAAMAVAFFC